MSVLLFVILLPFGTSLLGALLGLLDRADHADALRRSAWRGLPFVAAAALFGSGAALPSLFALLTALGLHLACNSGVRLLMRRRAMMDASTAWWGDD